MEFMVHQVDLNEFLKLLTELPANYLGDFENSALISSKSCGQVQWAKLYLKGNSDCFRVIQCTPHHKVLENQLIVKNDVYFNLCNSLRCDATTDSIHTVLNFEPDEYFPNVVDNVKVSLVQTTCKISNEDEETMLQDYFSSPKYLYVGDVVRIPLNKSIKNSAAYLGISNIYFKVVSAMHSAAEEHTKQGFYVMNSFTDLFSVSPSPSYLPPKSPYLLFLTEPVLPRVPPDLDSYVNTVRSLFLPFTKGSQTDCLPFFILSGVSGLGKLLTLRLVGELLGLHLLSVNSYEFCNVGVTAAEVKLDYLMEKALKIGPCILTISNFELIGRNKQGQKDPRFVDAFLTRCMSALKSASSYPLYIVGVTESKPEDLLPAITRAAVQIIKFSVADPHTALQTLSWLARKKSHAVEDSELHRIEKKLNGFVHSDLALLVDHSVRNKRIRSSDYLDIADLEYGLDLMEKAYSDTIGVAKVPDVKWDDVGGLKEIKEEIQLTLNMSSSRRQLRRSGILFYGPPGTGKTLMAKAVATECAMNFLSVKGPELMNMYVGQSEKNVREVFERAREAAPCILFFDELDSLAPNRGKSGDGGGVTDRVVSQLLAELDGLHSNRGLFVIAATNRPDLVDSALLRPGRFDKKFYLGPLEHINAKLGVLTALTHRFSLSDNVDPERIAAILPNHVTGADVYSVCSNAWVSSLRRHLTDTHKGKNVSLPLVVSMEDFLFGISQMVPSLTEADLLYYQKLSRTTTSD